MLISLLLIAIAAAGGLAVTYLIEKDEPFMWRLAAATVIGSSLFGTLAFIVASILGLSAPTVLASLVLAASPALLFARDTYRRRLASDWARAKNRLRGATSPNALRVAFYAFFFLLFFFFFDRTMLEPAAGIFIGGSQNLGDLPLHLGAILSFTEANNFPPQNPSYAGARFSYPFISDLLTACAVKLGASIRDAMFVQNLLWTFSLLIIFERFVFKLVANRLAARLAVPILFFSGGLGFVWFFADYWAQPKSFFAFLSQMPYDYTIRDTFRSLDTEVSFRWGNSMVVLFMTQRSLTLGLPLTLIVLGWLWKVFSEKPKGITEASENAVPASPRPRVSLSPFLIGLLAGLLPLIHLHSLVALFVVGLFLFILQPEKWLTWISFAAGVAVVAVPELLWSVTGSASASTKFFDWYFGWDKGNQNFMWFWFINTGLVIPLLAAGLYVAAFAFSRDRKKTKVKESKAGKTKAGAIEGDGEFSTHNLPLLWFYTPFAFLFLVSNIAKLAPWQWDNIKLLIYWFVGSLPFIALAVAWLWRRQNTGLRIAAVLCFVLLTASGSLDIWRTVSGQINHKVFDKDAVEIAQQLRLRTPANAVFLNAPTYNTAVVMSGRQSVMRYTGHLHSHGIDFAARESDVKRMYQGGPESAALLERYGVTHVLISPEERLTVAPNDQFFSRYPVIAEVGAFKVYKIQ